MFNDTSTSTKQDDASQYRLVAFYSVCAGVTIDNNSCVLDMRVGSPRYRSLGDQLARCIRRSAAARGPCNGVGLA